MPSELAKQHIRRAGQLREKRGVWHNHWDDLADIFLQRRLGFASSPVDGDRRTDHLYDGTPMQAARGLANSLAGLLRPQSQKWKWIKAADDEIDELDEFKEWAEQAENALDAEFAEPSARFLQASAEVDLDLAVFGTAVMLVRESENLNRLLFQSIHLKDAVVFFDDDGNARGMYQYRKMTLQQAEEKWRGKGVLSAVSQQALQDKKLDEKVEFLHAVVPREGGRPDALLSKNFPWTDLWIEVAESHIVQEGGFREFPYIVPRWDTSSGETYGRSPGMIALPDGSTLQAMGETMLVAGQRAAAPPLGVPSDGMFSAVNTFPDGLIYYDPTMFNGRNPFFPIEGGSNMPLTRDMQEDMRNQVFAAFFRNVLNLPVEGPQMTATEVNQRKQEFLREAGPVFGRLETDYTAPMVERAFNILLRAGRLPALPEVLEGRAIRFEYESPVKRVRQQIDAAAARLWRNDLEEMAANTGDPSVLDKINKDKYADFTAEAAGIPNDLVNDEDEVARLREARAQAQAEAQETENLERGVEIAGGLAGAANQAGLTAGT